MCDFLFSHQLLLDYQATLRQHIQRTHIDIPSNDNDQQYRCPYCGLGFKLFATFNEHFLAQHKDMNVKNVYPCYKCKRVYLVKNFFLKHECCKSSTLLSRSTLVDTPTLSCDVCSGQFNNADELLCHQMTCLDKSLRHCCSVCNQAYDSHRKLARHMTSHVLPPDQNSTFSCDVCGAKRTSARTLKLHKRSHNIQRPFPCTICKVACKTEAQLQHHQDVKHLMKRKYECDVCGKKFR
jgi:KRAB domain-containing zinc finger protein